MNNALLASRIDDNSTTVQALAKTLLLVLEDATPDASDYARDMHLPILDYVCKQLFAVSDNMNGLLSEVMA